MSTIPRGFSDLVLDRLVTALETFRDRETAIDPAVNFAVERDSVSPWDVLSGPLVVLEAGADAPETSGSSRTLTQYTLTIEALCVCPLAGTPLAAALRLAYLKEQVRMGLSRLADTDLAFPAGTISRRGAPAWTPLEIEDRELSSVVRVGKWTLALGYTYRPEDITGEALSEVSVNAGLWSGLYPIGGA